MTLAEIDYWIAAAGTAIDGAIRFVVDLATSFINDARVILIAKRNEFLTSLNAWFAQTNGILKLFVIFVIAGVVMVGGELVAQFVLNAATLSSIFAVAGPMAETIKLTLAWNSLKLAWSIIIVLDQNFRELEQAWRDLVSLIDDLLGVPLGFFTAITQSYSMYVSALYALAGIPQENARIQALSNIAKWFSQLQAGVTYYATKPGRIIDLLLGYALQADAEAAGELSYLQLQELQTAFNLAVNASANLQRITDSFKEFQNAFPEELQEEVDRQLAPVYTFIEEQLAPIFEQISEIANTIKPFVDEWIQSMIQPISADVQRAMEWIDKFKALLGFKPEVLIQQEQYLSELFGVVLLPSYTERDVSKTIAMAAKEWSNQNFIPESAPSGGTPNITGVTTLPPIVSREVNDWYIPIAAPSGTPGWMVANA